MSEIIKESFTYKLKTPISVSVGGNEESCDEVVVFSPRKNDRFNILNVEHYLKKSFFNMQSNRQSSNDESKVSSTNTDMEEESSIDEKSDMIELIVIGNLEPKDIRSMVLDFGEIICSGNTQSPRATIGGVKFTKPLYEELSVDDIKALIGRYAVNFLSLKGFM